MAPSCPPAPDAEHEAACGAEFQKQLSFRSRCKSPRPHERGPSVIGPERFPRRSSKRAPDYPFGGNRSIEQLHFPEVHHPIAVLLPESFRGGCSFGGCLRLSPARDRVLASPAAPPADRDVAKHHREGSKGVNEGRQGPRVTHILSGISIPSRPRTPVRTDRTRVQSPSRAARKAPSASDRTWCSA